MFVKKFFIIFILALNLILPVSALAAGWDYTSDGPDLGFEFGSYTGLQNQDVRFTTAQIIRTAMGVLGIVDMAIILYAGFLWMTAGGNEEKVGDAKKWLYGSVIGLIIILSAYSISTFVIRRTVSATTESDYGNVNSQDPRQDPRFWTQ